MSTEMLLAGGGLSVGLLILLVAKFKVDAFLSLLIASLAMGLLVGMPFAAINKAFGEGMGAVLGTVAPIVGLGAILGRLLMDSGGAQVLARRIVGATGHNLLPWTMLLLGLVVGAATWFAVGLVILAPILFGLYQESKKPFLLLALPMICGLSVMHGFVPPHPGPVVAIQLLGADMGKVILLSVLVGVPTAIICGPLLAFVFQRRMSIIPAATPVSAASIKPDREPSVGATILTIIFPIGLMILSTMAQVMLRADSVVREVFTFVGGPVVALLLGVLLALWTFGGRCGFNRKQLASSVERSLGPIASVLLVVGAGGGFSRVLLESGVGKSIAAIAAGWAISPLILAWLTAAVIRIATGSATVAISTAAGIMAPILQNGNASPEAIVISMAAGSLTVSHLNDGGFWFAKEYLGLTVAETLKTWTVMETLVSLVALGLLFLLKGFI